MARVNRPTQHQFAPGDVAFYPEVEHKVTIVSKINAMEYLVNVGKTELTDRMGCSVGWRGRPTETGTDTNHFYWYVKGENLVPIGSSSAKKPAKKAEPQVEIQKQNLFIWETPIAHGKKLARAGFYFAFAGSDGTTGHQGGPFSSKFDARTEAKRIAVRFKFKFNEVSG
jgi:hypothetical protein